MATSYSNPGGTGDRTASITVTSTLSVTGSLSHAINGNLTETDWFFNGETVSGKTLTFDFGAGASKIIDTFRYKEQFTVSQGIWQWQGSNDGSSYTLLGNTFDLLGNISGFVEITEPAGNTTGYRYYQLIGSSGSTNSGPWQFEFEFKIADAAALLNVVAAQTVPAFAQTFTTGAPTRLAVAAQTVSAFPQAFTTGAPTRLLVASQSINDFLATVVPITRPVTRIGTMRVGGRPRQVS